MHYVFVCCKVMAKPATKESKNYNRTIVVAKLHSLNGMNYFFQLSNLMKAVQYVHSRG